MSGISENVEIYVRWKEYDTFGNSEIVFVTLDEQSAIFRDTEEANGADRLTIWINGLEKETFHFVKPHWVEPETGLNFIQMQPNTEIKKEE